MLNNWTGQGRLVKDVDLNHGPDNVPVASFTIAVERNYKNRDGEREADFIEIVAWNKLGEFASNYFHKGDMIVVQGPVTVGSYTDKNGVKRRSFTIRAKELFFGGPKRQSSDESANYQSNSYYSDDNPGEGFINIPDDIDEELPFPT